MGVYIRQRDDESFKVSLRSNNETDVAKVAISFGGGGHIKASGFLIRKPLDVVKKEIVKEIKKQFV